MHKSSFFRIRRRILKKKSFLSVFQRIFCFFHSFLLLIWKSTLNSSKNCAICHFSPPENQHFWGFFTFSPKTRVKIWIFQQKWPIMGTRRTETATSSTELDLPPIFTTEMKIYRNGKRCEASNGTFYARKLPENLNFSRDLILHSDGGQLYTQLVTRSRLQYEIPCKFLLEAQYGQVKVGENFDVTVSSRNHTFGMRIDQPADNGAIKITAYIDFWISTWIYAICDIFLIVTMCILWINFLFCRLSVKYWILTNFMIIFSSFP